MPIPLDDLNAKIFREQLHSQFKVHQDNTAPITVELVDVVENESFTKDGAFLASFSRPIQATAQPADTSSGT